MWHLPTLVSENKILKKKFVSGPDILNSRLTVSPTRRKERSKEKKNTIVSILIVLLYRLYFAG